MSSTIRGQKGVFSFVAIRWASRKRGFLLRGSVSAPSTAVASSLMGMRVWMGNREFSNISRDTRRSRYESSEVGAAEDEEVWGWRRGRAATTVHGVVVVGGGMAAAASVTVAAGAATGAVAKVTEAAGRCDSVRVATEVAVLGGAWAECSDRSGAGGTAAAGAATGAAAEVTAADAGGAEGRGESGESGS